MDECFDEFFFALPLSNRQKYEIKRRRDPKYILRMRQHRAKWRRNNPEKWKECYTSCRHKKLISEPWYRLFILVTSRCFAKSHHYYKRNIKCYLTSQDIKHLWFRDKAFLLK